MIIIEGSDGAGKSTLVRSLCHDLGLQVGQRATDNRDELWKVTRQDTYTALGDAVRGQEPLRVWDRLFFSEMVYHDIVGRKCEFSVAEQYFIRRIINAMAAPVIVCQPPLRVVRDNVGKDKQMSGVVENINTIYQRYTGLMPQYAHYDYTEANNGSNFWNYNDILATCRNYIRIRGERSW